MPQLPAGDVTFMFTDMEGSTRLFHRLGPSYPAVLDAHNAILRKAITDAGGAEVKTEGDAFFAAFPAAAAAAGAALTAHAGVAAHDWPDEVEIRVRIGLHTGQASPVDGDYVALPVHLAARVEGAANGGQTLISHATAVLLRDWSGGCLEPIGRFWLKDFDEPQILYALTPEAPRLPHSPPRARRADVNLPPVLDEVIGREEEENALAEMLVAERLVSIVGPGGMGKTTLAVATAERSIPSFRGGVWFVDLATVSSDDAVLGAVADVLGVEQTTASIMAAISSERSLLVLDNCEHLLRGAAAIASAVVSGSASAVVLATSRERLGVRGERVRTLEGLKLPSPTATTPEEISGSAAVRLFLERAAMARPGFAATREDLLAARDICIALDGMPLAITLASARLGVLAPRQLLERLDRRLALLGGRGSGRQDTLRSLLDWSYELLEERERAALRRLGVIAGSASLEVAAAVADIADELELLDTVGALVEKSLVQRVDAEAGTRFRLLETIRQYAEARLQEAGEVDVTYERLVLALVLQLTAGGVDPVPASEEQFRLERENLRACFGWTINSGRDDLAMPVARFAAPLWDAWGDWDLLGPLREFLQRSDPSVEGWAQIATAGAWMAYRAREMETAEQLALAVLDSAGLERRHGVGGAKHLLAIIRMLEGRLDEARSLVAQAQDEYEATGLSRAVALHNVRAGIEHRAGDLDAARAEYNAGITAAADSELAALPRISLGRLELEAGRLEDARRVLDQAVVSCRRTGLPPPLQQALANLALVETAARRFDIAAELVDEGLSLHVPSPSPQLLLAAAEVAAHEGRQADATAFLDGLQRIPGRRADFIHARVDALRASIAALRKVT